MVKSRVKGLIFSSVVMGIILMTPISQASSYKATGNLNMRDGSTNQHGIIKILPKGTVVIKIEEENGWLKVNDTGTIGFVNGEYLEKVEEASNILAVKDEYTVDATLNLRGGDSVETEIVAIMPKGSIVKHLDTSQNGWLKVDFNSKIGYASNKYLTKKTNSEVKPETKPEIKPGAVTRPYKTTVNINMRSEMSEDSKLILTIQKGETVDRLAWYPSIGWSKIIYRGEIGYVKQDYLTSPNNKLVPESTPEPEPATIPYKTIANVNMRSQMSKNSNLITTIKQGETVARLAWYPSIGWSKIIYKGQTGYVMQDYLTSNSKPAPVTLKRKTNANVNMRSEMSENSKLILTIQEGEIVDRLAWYPSIGWSKIIYKGEMGYVNEGYLTSPNTPTQKPEPPIVKPITFKSRTIANVNMTVGMSENSNLMHTIPQGTNVERLAWYPSTGWSKIIYKGETGYVNQDYLIGANAPAPVTLTRKTIASVNMRKERSDNSKLILTIPQGEIVERLAWYPSIGWSKIIYKGEMGYVNEDYLTSPNTPNTQPEKPLLKSLTIEGVLIEKNILTLKADASSKNGVLYKFYIKDLANKKTSVIQDYNKNNYVSWTPDTSGSYEYGVYARDTSNKDAKHDVHLVQKVVIQVKPAKLEELTISGAGFINKEHILRAKATASNDLIYEFYVKNIATDELTLIQAYSGKDTATWTPKKPGKYLYGVHVKDIKSINDKDDEEYIEYNVKTPIQYKVTEYEDTLEQALEKQMNISGTKPQTTNGNKWVNASKEETEKHLNPDNFLQFVPEYSPPKYTEGVVTASSLNIRSGPSSAYSIIAVTHKGTIHKILKESNGWLMVEINGLTGWLSGNHIDKVNTVVSEDKNMSTIQITAPGLNLRQEPNTTSTILTTVVNGNIYVVQGIEGNWYKINAGGKVGWVSANYARSVNDVPREMYQFMVLSGQSGVNQIQMNTTLRGKGILEGHGAAFMEGSRKYNVNEMYLMAHVLLETGNGTSRLARGILVTSVDGKAVTPRTVYNMYGVGAYDSNPIQGGTELAYKQGWFTPEIAITEGAHWISRNYINNDLYKQDTLYKMKWNPIKPTVHQYATDIGWALKQTRQIDIMMDLIKDIEDAQLRFDLPRYHKDLPM